MAVVLARIDDRFIHGQVIVGWSEHLQPDRILLVDNAIAADSWQSRVYASSVPPTIEVTIQSIARSAALLRSGSLERERVIVLTGGPVEMAELAKVGAPLENINVGGMHFGPGKREMLPFVFVDGHDLTALRRLLEMGATLSAQQIPGGREYQLTEQMIGAMQEAP